MAKFYSRLSMLINRKFVVSNDLSAGLKSQNFPVGGGACPQTP